MALAGVPLQCSDVVCSKWASYRAPASPYDDRRSGVPAQHTCVQYRQEVRCAQDEDMDTQARKDDQSFLCQRVSCGTDLAMLPEGERESVLESLVVTQNVGGSRDSPACLVALFSGD